MIFLFLFAIDCHSQKVMHLLHRIEAFIMAFEILKTGRLIQRWENVFGSHTCFWEKSPLESDNNMLGVALRLSNANVCTDDAFYISQSMISQCLNDGKTRDRMELPRVLWLLDPWQSHLWYGLSCKTWMQSWISLGHRHPPTLSSLHLMMQRSPTYPYEYGHQYDTTFVYILYRSIILQNLHHDLYKGPWHHPTKNNRFNGPP